MGLLEGLKCPVSMQGQRYILDPIILAKIHIEEHIKMILERKVGHNATHP